MKPKQKTTEAQTLSAIIEYLTILEKQGKIMFLRVDSGARPIAYETKDGWKKHFIRYGKKGWPDILVWKSRKIEIVNRIGGWSITPANVMGEGKLYQIVLDSFFIEVKRPDTKLSLDQVVFQKKVEKMGGRYDVVRSIEDVEKILSL